MRYLTFLLCFALSYWAWFFFHNEKDPPIGDEIKQSIAVRTNGQSPSSRPFPIATPESRRQWTDLEYQGEISIEYNGLMIENTLRGLSINRKGKRLLYLKNAHDRAIYGVFGMRKLLNNGREQLVYLSTSGGNHCCARFVIVDMAKSGPKVIFRSADYDVQIGESNDDNALMTFDLEDDGRLEITQKTTFGLGSDCPEVSNPATYIGFKYDEIEKKYVPMRRASPTMEQWIDERKDRVEKENAIIEQDQFPESDCGYVSDLTAVALYNIYIGKELEGIDYVLKRYRALDYTSNPPRFSQKATRNGALKVVKDIKKTMSYDSLYHAIYSR